MFRAFFIVFLLVFFSGYEKNKLDIKVSNLGAKVVKNFCIHFENSKTKEEKCFENLKNNQIEEFFLEIGGEGEVSISYSFENKKVFDKEIVVGYISGGEQGYINIEIINEIMRVEKNTSFHYYPKNKNDGMYEFNIIKSKSIF